MSINDSDNIIKQLEREELVLRERINALEGQLGEIRLQIRKLKGNDTTPWTEKAMECISSSKVLLSTDEILQCIFWYRKSELNDPEKRRGYITALSVALNKLCRNGKLISRLVKGVKGLYYGLPEWEEKEGVLKAYYQFTLEDKIKVIINNKNSFYREKNYA